jgi:hypothetical protein
MRSTIILPLIAVLALAGCKKEGVVAKDESVESVAKKVAAANLKPQAGRWESTMKIDKMEMANMPPAAQEAMNKRSNVSQTFASCLTQAEADKPDASFFQKGAQDCKYDHFVMEGGRIDAQMQCNQDNRKMKMTMSGTYSQTAYTMNIKSEGEMQPGMPVAMDMSITARRTGECTGSEEK